MKKLAFLFFGHMRSYEFTHPSFLKVLNNLKNYYKCDVFIHTWDELEPLTPTHHDGFKKVINRKVIKNEISSIYSPTDILVEKQVIKHPNKTIFHNQCEEGILYTQYSRYKVNELKKQHEILHNFKYDIVIMSRPDIIFYQNFLNSELKDSNSLWLSQVFLGGASDILYFSNSKNIDKVCEFYNQFNSIPKSHNIESTWEIFLKYLNLNIQISKYCMPRDWKITRSWWGEDQNPSPGTSDHKAWDKFIGTKEINQNSKYSYYRY